MTNNIFGEWEHTHNGSTTQIYFMLRHTQLSTQFWREKEENKGELNNLGEESCISFFVKLPNFFCLFFIVFTRNKEILQAAQQIIDDDRAAAMISVVVGCCTKQRWVLVSLFSRGRCYYV